MEKDLYAVTNAATIELDSPNKDLEDALSALKRDLSKLSVNLCTIDHTVETECSGLTLRLHYPAFRQSKPMVSELIDAVSMHIVNFCLPRKHVTDLHDLYGKIGSEEFTQRFEALRQEAFDLFKRAHLATNRSGEAGELILYLLTEWLLGAPQIIAKMSWPAPGSEDTKLGVLMGQEVRHGASEVYTGVQA